MSDIIAGMMVNEIHVQFAYFMADVQWSPSVFCADAVLSSIEHFAVTKAFIGLVFEFLAGTSVVLRKIAWTGDPTSPMPSPPASLARLSNHAAICSILGSIGFPFLRISSIIFAPGPNGMGLLACPGLLVLATAVPLPGIAVPLQGRQVSFDGCIDGRHVVLKRSCSIIISSFWHKARLSTGFLTSKESMAWFTKAHQRLRSDTGLSLMIKGHSLIWYSKVKMILLWRFDLQVSGCPDSLKIFPASAKSTLLFMGINRALLMILQALEKPFEVI